MNINATLLGQMITFAIFTGITMKYIWPPVVAAMDKRQKEIADGLAAAKSGQEELINAQAKCNLILKDAKEEATLLVTQAKQKATKILNNVKQEQTRLQQGAEKDLLVQKERIQQELMRDAVNQIATLAVGGAEKILASQLDKAANHQLVKRMLDDLGTPE